MKTKSRLWNQWSVLFRCNGLAAVIQPDNKPQLHIFPDVGINTDRQDGDRVSMTFQLREFLNGGERPEWLDDMYEIRTGNLWCLTGAMIGIAGGTTKEREDLREVLLGGWY